MLYGDLCSYMKRRPTYMAFVQAGPVMAAWAGPIWHGLMAWALYGVWPMTLCDILQVYSQCAPYGAMISLYDGDPMLIIFRPQCSTLIYLVIL
jgi:hypothetical protein